MSRSAPHRATPRRARHRGCARRARATGRVQDRCMVSDEGKTATRLRRAVTGPLLFLFILGDVLGAGVYALIGEMAGAAGGFVWLAFGVALVMALLTAFSYAELVTKYPRAGG